MMEGTGGLQYLLPAIIAIYVGNWVAHHIHHEGAYEADLERLGMLSPHSPCIFYCEMQLLLSAFCDKSRPTFVTF